MRILYHHRTLGDGAEGIHIREMVSAFRSLGHEVRLVGPAAKETPAPASGKTSRLGILKKLFRGPAYEALELGYNLAAWLNLSREIREFKPDFIYDRYMIYNYAVVGLGRKLGIPVFLEFNAPLAYERSLERDERLYFSRLAHHLEARISKDAFRTITVSTPLKEYLVGQGVPGNQVLVMANGVNPETFHPVSRSAALLKKYGIAPQSKIIGFTGILRPWHGIDMLVKAFCEIHKKHPDAVLLLVGDGAIRKEIEALSREKDCAKSVIITGRVPHDQVNEHIGLFDLAVSPKTTFYASPMKIPEYMAQAKAVVAPDTPNIHDLIENRHTGCLFRKDSSHSLAWTLDSLLGDDELRSQVGQAGYREVYARLNWQQIARNIISVYEAGGGN